MLALSGGGHRWCAEDGRWQGSYVPAFIRRYPFALTQEGTVCIDRQAPALAGEKGEALFGEDGANTPALNRVIQYLNLFEREYARTREFSAALKAQELFKPFVLQVMQKGQAPQRLDGLFVLDEKKLSELPDALVTEWFRKGWLGWTFAHLHSLSSLDRLNRELDKSAS